METAVYPDSLKVGDQIHPHHDSVYDDWKTITSIAAKGQGYSVRTDDLPEYPFWFSPTELIRVRTNERRTLKVRLEWKLEDCWIGAFWKRDESGLHIWVCLVPCLPLHVQWSEKERNNG